jgi:hypothetical protein
MPANADESPLRQHPHSTASSASSPVTPCSVRPPLRGFTCTSDGDLDRRTRRTNVRIWRDEGCQAPAVDPLLPDGLGASAPRTMCRDCQVSRVNWRPVRICPLSGSGRRRRRGRGRGRGRGRLTDCHPTRLDEACGLFAGMRISRRRPQLSIMPAWPLLAPRQRLVRVQVTTDGGVACRGTRDRRSSRP